jgi:hypothetical protein
MTNLCDAELAAAILKPLPNDEEPPGHSNVGAWRERATYYAVNNKVVTYQLLRRQKIVFAKAAGATKDRVFVEEMKPGDARLRAVHRGLASLVGFEGAAADGA